MFLKWIKKNKLKIIATGICSIAIAIFTIISFSCKTYAYSIDNNGNLVGDNLWDISQTQHNGRLSVNINEQTYTITSTASNEYYEWIELYTLNNVVIGKTYTMSYNVTSNGTANTIFLKSAYGNIDTNIYPNTDMIVRYENQRYVKSFTATTTTCVIGVFLNIGVSDGAQCIISNIMLNEGDDALDWEPYGVWYNENNYNAVVEDNEELLEQINKRTTKELQSGIKANLQGTYLKVYNAENLSLSQMQITNPFYQEQITFTEDQLNYNMSLNNTEVYNAILNNNGEFMNGQQLTTDYPTLLYTFKTPLYIQALTFSRGDTSGTRYINIYFSDNSSTELLLAEGSENNRTDITWTNETNKYVTYISTTAEVGFNLVEIFTIPNSSQIYTSGYEQGYTDGWYESYQSVADNIQNANQNLQAKYNEGYNEGYQKGASSNNSLYNMVIRS